jgi:hypothetical protein
MIAVKISVIVSILDRADNVHYIRNGGTWKLKRKTITFGSVGKNTVVGTVPNVGNISHAYGMVLLGSGSTVPLAFLHPELPESRGIVQHQRIWPDFHSVRFRKHVAERAHHNLLGVLAIILDWIHDASG